MENLVNEAMKARENAYSPYSGFKVGAAVLCADGKIFNGCNVENASYGATVCAERNAINTAIGQGERKFSAISIIASEGDYCFPCGICLQVISEFCEKDFKFILCKPNGEFIEKTLSELLPMQFKL